MDVGEAGVRAGDERDDVARQRCGLGEAHHRRPVLSAAVAFRARADGQPAVGDGDVDREPSLQVGLVEAGEHPVGIERLELGVDVDRVVDRVDEAMQAHAGALVGAPGDHADLVDG